MCRSFISAAERALIKSCAENSVGIEQLEGAPGFRYYPPDQLPGWEGFRPPLPKKSPDFGAPSKRTLSFKRKAHMRKIKTWSPQSLTWGEADLRIPMAGDAPALTKARRAYADGDPALLRAWLSSRSKTVAAAVEFQPELLAA